MIVEVSVERAEFFFGSARLVQASLAKTLIRVLVVRGKIQIGTRNNPLRHHAPTDSITAGKQAEV